jgi:hypothetical protein
VGLRSFGQSPEPGHVCHRDFRENLAIQFDSSLFKPPDQLVIRETVDFRRGADPGNPKSAKVAGCSDLSLTLLTHL